MKKNILLSILFLGIGIALMGFIMSNNGSEVPYSDTYRVTKGPRFIHQPTDMLRDYQLKISEDEKSFIVYQYERKVGVIPFKPMSVKLDKASLSYLMWTDDYYRREQ